jgi:hypothetical protein
MIRSFFLTLFLVLLLSPSAGGNGLLLPSHAPGSGDVLFDFLLSVTNPDSLELRMDEPPDGEGNIRHASFVIRGACFGGLRVEKIAAEFFFLELNAPDEWRSGRRHSLKVNGVLRTNAEVVILDRDINDALGAFPARRGRLSVNFFPGSVRVLGLYGTELGRIRVETASSLAVENGNQIVMENTGIRINGHDRTDAFRQEIYGLNPLLDLADFPLPASRWILRVDDVSLRLSTPVPPKEAEGLTWRHEREALPLPPPEPFKFTPERFENGDIILVNGKSWRSKALLFFFSRPDDFSHSGMVRWSGGLPWVIHASPESERVEMEPLQEFLSPFEIEKAEVYRLKGNTMAAERAGRAAWGYFLEGRPFDDLFDNRDEKAMYCTELIWKACETAGVDLFGGKRSSYFSPVPFYGNVLFPSALIRSPLLEKVMTLD